MKERISVFVLAFLSLAVNLYAANGDLIVSNNLGVGNTAPTYKLDVSGDVRFTGILQGGSVPWARLTTFPSACASGQYVSAVGATLTCSTPYGTGGGISGSGTTDYIPKWTGGTSLGNSLIYNNATGVGIGTASPLTLLHLKSLSGAARVLIENSAGNSYFINTWGTDMFSIGRNNPWTNYLTIDAVGRIGIGTTSPQNQLELSSDSAAKLASNTWSVTSDARLKTDIQPYTKGLKELLQINSVTYKYNGKGGIGHNKFKRFDPKTGEETEVEIIDTELLSKTNIGVLAQEIQAVVPETVTSHKGKIDKEDKEETDILDFDSHALTFILINAVKELKAEIDSLNAQIADLNAKIK